MTFRLTIKCDNAAFDGDRDMEIARILKRAANTVEVQGACSFPLLDVNGNTVGKATLSGRRS